MSTDHERRAQQYWQRFPNTDPFGADEEIRQGLDQIAAIATQNALEAIVESQSSIQAANTLIANAGLIAAFGSKDEAKNYLRVFEQMGLAEDEETASVFCMYRSHQIHALVKAGASFDDERITKIIAEQESSEFQDGHSTLGMYHDLARNGDNVSMVKWLKITVSEMLGSTEKTSEFNPFPEYRYAGNLARLVIHRGTPFDIAGEITNERLNTFVKTMSEIIEETSRKALFADRLRIYVTKVIDREHAPILSEEMSKEARELSFRMLKQGAEDPLDRNATDITYCRLHKHQLADLTDLAIRDSSRTDEINKLFAAWTQNGMFSDIDLVRIERWKAETHSKIQNEERQREKWARRRNRY